MAMPQLPLKDTNEAINEAGKLVDKYLNSDRSFYDLSGLLSITTHKHANLSGHLDSAYPALSSSLPALTGMPFLGDISHTPLPQELLEEFDNMQCNSAMGLMPLIRRAWLTIDSTIYIWNYENGRDLAYFDGLKEVILGVGIVIPKPNIFQDHIQYLLCLTTPQEIVILGVSFADSNLDPFGEMHLLPEPLFALPTDNTCMLDMAGTSCTGRIFLGGKDGCLYEILYQAEEGWFSRKCRKVNHSTSIFSYILPSFLSFSEEDPIVQIIEDGMRHILYSRSEKGSIRVYDLGGDGTSLSAVSHISMDTIRHRAIEACIHFQFGQVDKTLFKSIVHIAVIPLLESSTLHLMAVTQAGVRLYFTTTPQGLSQRPSLISLVHVRLPPGYCPSNAAMRPGNATHQAFYRRGCLLLACSQTDDRDLIWLVDSDSFPFQSNLMESFITYPLNGRTWTMAESIESGELDSTDSFSLLPPSVVSQHAMPPRRFILLSTEGSYILTKLRPVDQLRNLFEQHQTGCCEPVEAFFRLYGDAQACAMCLILATTPNKEISEWATEAYIKFGGEPHFIFPTTLGPGQLMSGASPHSMGSPIGSPYQSHPQPLSPVSGTLGRPVMGPEIQLSGKHDGMCLQLARLLGQLWHCPIAMRGPDNKYYSRYDSNELSVLAEQLHEMREFMDSNAHFFTAPVAQQSHTPGAFNVHQRMLNFMRPQNLSSNDPQHVQQSMLNKYKTDAYLIECNSLQEVNLLLSRICECLSLWKLICEHQFELVTESVDQSKQTLLESVTFKGFVTGGKELSSLLIKSLLTRYTGDSTITDSLMSRLRQLSPSLFSQEDATSSKAQELITLATALDNPAEKLSMLRESLKLYSQVTDQISLSGVSEHYRALRYYEGIVELALCTASNADPQNIGLHYYNSGHTSDDAIGQEVLSRRQESYAVVTGVLSQLLNSSRNISSPSIPKKPGPPTTREETKPDPLTDFNNMLTLCLRSDDELFHVTLYTWLLSHGVNMADKLIEIQSPFIEKFLIDRASLQQQDNVQIFDLLWKYYEKNRNYLAASKILDQLAHKDDDSLKLSQRLDYISRAVMCAKSSGAVTNISGEGEFLHELEEKMEVARVQLSIINALGQLPSSRHIEAAIKDLNSELMDVSKLYGDFAEPFDLPECKLSIVHLAGHHDPTLIESLWREIIEHELESTLQLNGQARMASMKTKLIQLGQIYSRNERYFPTIFLIKLLEQHCCQLHWEPTLIPQIFYSIGVSYPSLFSVYHSMFINKDSFWQTAGSPLHVLSVILALLTTIANNTSLVSSYERSSFLKNVLDKVGGYLVELQTLNPTTPNLTMLMTGLRDLERKITMTMKN